MQTIVLYFYSLRGYGGAEKMLTTLCRCLIESGFSVHIITLDNAADFYYTQSKGVSVHAIGPQGTLLGKFKRVKKIVSVLKLNKADALIGFVMSADKTIYLSCLLASVKIIVAERNGPDMYKYRLSFLGRKLVMSFLSLSNIITVQQESFVKCYPKHLRKKIRVIGNPVKSMILEAVPGYPSKEGNFYLLSVSRIDQCQKDILTLVKAFSLIAYRFPNWTLKIVGDGPDHLMVKVEVLKLKLEKQVEFLKPVSDLSKIYSSSHLFVLSSKWEGFPNALAEAMAYGLPCIGFEKAQGVSDLILDGVTGWLAKNIGDPVSLAKSMEAAMSNAQERGVRGANSKMEVKKYTYTSFKESWKNILSLL